MTNKDKAARELDEQLYLAWVETLPIEKRSMDEILPVAEQELYQEWWPCVKPAIEYGRSSLARELLEWVEGEGSLGPKPFTTAGIIEREQIKQQLRKKLEGEM